MKQLFIVFLLINSVANVFGQQPDMAKVKTIILCAPAKTDTANNAIFIVNNKYMISSIINLKDRFDAKDVEDLTIHSKRDSLIRLYGEKGKNGLISLELKKTARLIEIEELFDKFNIKAKDQSLPLYINETLVTDHANFFMVLTKIKQVKVRRKATLGIPDLEFIAIKTKP